MAGDFDEAQATVPAWFLPKADPVTSPPGGAEAPQSAVVLPTPLKAKSIKKVGSYDQCQFPTWLVVRRLHTSGTAAGGS